MISKKLKNTGKKLQSAKAITMLPYGLRNALMTDVPKSLIPIP